MTTLKHYLAVCITIALFTSAFGFSVGACDTDEFGSDTFELLSEREGLSQVIYLPSFDLGGELVQEEWFDLDENPIVGADGWHRVDYIRDPRGLIIEEVGYGLDGQPETSFVLGYASLLLDYDEHGRETYAGYFDAEDQPVMVNQSVIGGTPESPESVDLSFHSVETSYLDDVTFERSYLNTRLEELHYELVDLLAETPGASSLVDEHDHADIERPGMAELKSEDETAAVGPNLEEIEVELEKIEAELEEFEAEEEEECGCGDDEEEYSDEEDHERRLEEIADCGPEGCYDEGDCEEGVDCDEEGNCFLDDILVCGNEDCDDEADCDEGMDCDDEADLDEGACDYLDVDCDDEEGCFESLMRDEGQENCWDSAREEEIADCGYEGCHDKPISALHDIADRLGLAIGEALELGYPQAPDAQPRAKEAKPEPETLKSETSADDHLQPEGWTQEEDLESDEWMEEEDLEDEAWMHDDPDEPGC